MMTNDIQKQPSLCVVQYDSENLDFQFNFISREECPSAIALASISLAYVRAPVAAFSAANPPTWSPSECVMRICRRSLGLCPRLVVYNAKEFKILYHIRKRSNVA